MDIRSLQELKQIADKFQFTERSVNLTWSHHKEIVSLKKLKEVNGKLTLSDDPDMDKIHELLSMAEKEEIPTPFTTLFSFVYEKYTIKVDI